jgi:hypothetical protein
LQRRHPGPVELQPPQRRAGQTIERAQATAEFIDDDLDAERVQRLEHR